jgi:hypothetical protein
VGRKRDPEAVGRARQAERLRYAVLLEDVGPELQVSPAVHALEQVRAVVERQGPGSALERLGHVAGERQVAAWQVELPQQAGDVGRDGNGIELPVDCVGSAGPPGADTDDARCPIRLRALGRERPDPLAVPLAARRLDVERRPDLTDVV